MALKRIKSTKRKDMNGYNIYLTDKEVEAFMTKGIKIGIDKFATYARVVILKDIREHEKKKKK
jgi:hypothetical protein